MNQISRRTRQCRRPRRSIWKKVVASWAIVAAVALAGGIAVGVMIAGKAAAENMVAYGAPTGYKTEMFAAMNVPLDVSLQKEIYAVSKQYGIDYTLLLAVMQQESQFDIHAKSDAGDFGLMQINRINHRNLSVVLGIHDFMDPVSNVRAGAYMLRDLFDKYHDVHKVLMCYQMGESGAAACWEQGITESQYSRAVLHIQRELIAQQHGFAV
jgi:soluble lytic murein transglycosylase-like protein